MAGYPRKTDAKRNRSTLNYFYMNGELHKINRVDRHLNLVKAYNYDRGERVQYVWSDVRRTAQRAFTIRQVADLLRVARTTILDHEWAKNIRKPDRGSDPDKTNWNRRRFYSEDDVLELYDYLITVHQGRPRKDGEITPNRNLPTRAELLANLKEIEVMYYRDHDGDFIAVWKPPSWL